MVNSDEFSKRLKKIMEYYEESASSFADKIGVQRSSISHILSGRNKPSLDFVMKILDSYPEVGLYWLLNGKGKFPQDSFNENEEVKPPFNQNIKDEESQHYASKTIKTFQDKTIERIVIFYKDGSFKSYLND